MSNTIYSEPRVTFAAKGLLKEPPEVDEYKTASALTVREVVEAIIKKSEEKILPKISTER